MAIPSICPKCETGLVNREEDGKPMLVCGVCGYKREVTVVTERACAACGYNKATVEFYGVIYGDEAPLVLYKCVKCGAVEREGYG